MGRLIRIQKEELAPLDFQGQRVVTFDMIDRLHGHAAGNAVRQFGRNKSRFIEGEDFFSLSRAQATEMIQLGQSVLIEQDQHVVVSPRGCIALTESGYLLLCKSFTDDLSWQVQRELVNVYFRAKEMVQGFQGDKDKLTQLMEYAQENNRRIIALIERQDSQLTETRHGVVRVEKKVDSMDSRLTDVERTVISIERYAVKRKDFSKKTKELYIKTVRQKYAGWCPCCGEEHLLDASGQPRRGVVEYDHWNERPSTAHMHQGWPVCRHCNQGFETGIVNRDANKLARFNVFQDNLRIVSGEKSLIPLPGLQVAK